MRKHAFGSALRGSLSVSSLSTLLVVHDRAPVVAVSLFTLPRGRFALLSTTAPYERQQCNRHYDCSPRATSKSPIATTLYPHHSANISISLQIIYSSALPSPFCLPRHFLVPGARVVCQASREVTCLPALSATRRSLQR